MGLVIQLLTGLLILISLGLIVTVPVALATPGEWEESKGSFYNWASLWSVLVIVTGLLTSIS